MCIRELLKNAFIYTTLGAMVIAYAIFGGMVFSELEKESGKSGRLAAVKAKDQYKDKMLQIINSSNINITEEVWTKLTGNLIDEFQYKTFMAVSDSNWDGENLDSDFQQWDLAAGILYSVCLMTTIGYGNIAPETDAGKLVTILYSILGIPIFLVFLSKVGSFLAVGFRIIFSCCVKKNKEKRSSSEEAVVHVPVSISLFMIVIYIIVGAVTFSNLEEDWDYLTSAYFCFITVSTIGLGDYVAGSGVGYHNSNLLILTTVYVLFGMALIVMIFALIQDEVQEKLKRLAACLTLTSGSVSKRPQKPKSPEKATPPPPKKTPDAMSARSEEETLTSTS